jgi:hypothetical protein
VAVVGEVDEGVVGEVAEEADVGVEGEVVGAEADDSDECDRDERNNPRSTVKRTRLKKRRWVP